MKIQKANHHVSLLLIFVFVLAACSFSNSGTYACADPYAHANGYDYV